MSNQPQIEKCSEAFAMGFIKAAAERDIQPAQATDLLKQAMTDWHQHLLAELLGPLVTGGLGAGFGVGMGALGNSFSDASEEQKKRNFRNAIIRGGLTGTAIGGAHTLRDMWNYQAPPTQQG